MVDTKPAVAGLISNECPDIRIRVASTRWERRGAFRIAYESYRRAGLCDPSELRMRFTPYQLIPSTDIIVAVLRDEVISTLSLVRDGEMGLPLEAIYPEQVEQRRAAGLKLAEVACLADRRQGEARFFGLFCELARVMVQLADRGGIDQLLIAVHPRHARMYSRAMTFAQVGDDRAYPAVNGNPAVLLCLDFETIKTRRPDRWQMFAGDPLPDEIVQPHPISAADSRYFAALGRHAIDDSPVRRNGDHGAESSASAALACA